MASPATTALFPDQGVAVADLKYQLQLGGGQYINLTGIPDSFLWDKLIAAEAAAERALRTFFSPVQVIPDTAPQSEIDALVAAGTRYVTTSGFDYDPAMFQAERWGLMNLPFKPAQSVQSVIIAFPAPFLMNYTVPPEWIRIDRKYAHLQLVPTTSAAVSPVGAFALVAIGGAVTYPQAIQVRYIAGLTNANGDVVSSFAENWADLIDLVKRMAIMNVMRMGFLPSSGSISADGLSQSNSFNYKAWQDGIDESLYGPKGSNGGLFASIHGINGWVLG